MVDLSLSRFLAFIAEMTYYSLVGLLGAGRSPSGGDFFIGIADSIADVGGIDGRGGGGGGSDGTKLESSVHIGLLEVS